ncbi:MAG: DNA gyrase inhibitor YacG [Micropepsaceae bacterium]
MNAAPACAVCGKPQADKFKPFCSRRCADIDLNRWLSGGYVIPGKPEADEDADET